MEEATDVSSNAIDFSEPWKLSDVILVVEEQRFHVHRSTLAFWSPVFEAMFTSNFKEKNSEEISLPGKKASEITVLLQIMYPSLEEKIVTKGNCYFLLDLAREYQITSITQKCEDFLVSAVKSREEDDVLAVLFLGKEYELKTLMKTCVYEARRLSLKDLKDHSKCGQIEPHMYLQIVEGIIERLEEQNKEVKTNSLKQVDALSRFLYNHAVDKGLYSYRICRGTSDYLNILKTDKIEHKCKSSSSSVICRSLGKAAEHLTELKDTLETLP